jgi:hypothetical protein
MTRDEFLRTDEIPAARVLITVKAYPKPSGKYEELVCTAGLLDGEHWIRIYPVPFRLLDDGSKYPKYAWIEMDLVRRKEKDFRPESFRPKRGIHEDIRVLDQISTRDSWRDRRTIVLKNVYDSMEKLISDAYSKPPVSLATLRPTEVVDVIVERAGREWPEHWQRFLIENDLFEPRDGGTKRPIKKVPYSFSYKFRTTDGKTRQLQIEDWELGALYWNCLKAAAGDEDRAVIQVREKYKSLALGDIHFFLGTTLQYHQRRAPNPFIIIGVFYPPKLLQKQLF